MKSPFLLRPRLLGALAGAAAGFFLFTAVAPSWTRAEAPGDTPNIPPDLPPGAQDVVKLTQAGLNEDVIVAQVRSAGYIYRLTADQIIELTNAGVSQNVIKALIAPNSPSPSSANPSGGDAAEVASAIEAMVRQSAAASAAGQQKAAAADAAEAAKDAVMQQQNEARAAAVAQAASVPAVEEPVPGVPPAAPVNFDYLQSELSPYGMWIQTPDYGWAWLPSVAAGDASWQPYCDQGQWLYTDLGWYWNSSYAWGRIAFHYGRWTRLQGYGWGWIPDYTWGPSWVCWRHDEAGGICGWAPLPPGSRFVAGFGLVYHGHLALDIDFGLRPDSFVFCSYGHLLDRNLRANLLPRERSSGLYERSIVRNHYGEINGRLSVEGLGRSRTQELTHHELRPVVLHSASSRSDERQTEAPRREIRSEAHPENRTIGSYPPPPRSSPMPGPRAPNSVAGHNAPPPPRNPAPGQGNPPADDKKKSN